MRFDGVEIRVVHSRRRTISLEITPQGEPLVRAPMRYPEWRILDFLEQHRSWLEKHLNRKREQLRQAAGLPPLTKAELHHLAEQALPDMKKRTESFAKRLGVTYGRITIRSQLTRWGSCSSAGNLSYNCLLMLAPPEVRDYIAVHELCHRLEMNHSPRFWALVAGIFPDYRLREEWLKREGPAHLARLRRLEQK